MTARALLHHLRSQGVHLELRGDVLRYRPKGALSPELVRAISALKGEILALLGDEDAAAGGSSRADDGPPPSWDQVVWNAPWNWRCYACGSRKRWRLAEGSEWVCGRCHPAEPDARIVWEADDLGNGQARVQPQRSVASPPSFWDGHVEDGRGLGGGG